MFPTQHECRHAHAEGPHASESTLLHYTATSAASCQGSGRIAIGVAYERNYLCSVAAWTGRRQKVGEERRKDGTDASGSSR